MEQKKRNAFLAIIVALILIIAVFVLLKKENTTNDNSAVAETEEIADLNDNSTAEYTEEITEKIVDYEVLGIKEYEYPAEFSMGDNLKTAITELALSFDNFDEDSVHSEWWEKLFISDFIQNSRLSFDYLEMTAEKNNGWIGIDELNYIHYSLTNVELDFSSYADAPVNRYDDSSGYSSGLITGWDYEDTDDGVIVTADFEVETSGSNAVWEQEITVNLVKNPYSCFDGYSIVSLSSKYIPLSVESGEYVFYGMDMTEEDEAKDGVHIFEFEYAEDNLHYGHFVYVDLTGLPEMEDFVSQNSGILKVTFFLEEGEITGNLGTVVPIDIALDDRWQEIPEEKLLAITEGAAGCEMETWAYVDMNHDASEELIGVYRDDSDHYHTWYCSSDGETCMQVHENNQWMDTCRIEFLEFDNETHVVINASCLLGPFKNYTILTLKDNDISCLLSNQYGYVYMTEAGDIILDVEAYDAMYDAGVGYMIGHTWKDTYLYYDGEVYREYGATRLTEDEFLQYGNAELLKDMIAGQLTQDDTEKLEYFYFVRKNNILHIQCNVYNSYGSVNYGYYTVRLSGNVLDEQLGEYTAGGMASYFSDLEVTY